MNCINGNNNYLQLVSRNDRYVSMVIGIAMTAKPNYLIMIPLRFLRYFLRPLREIVSSHPPLEESTLEEPTLEEKILIICSNKSK